MFFTDRKGLRDERHGKAYGKNDYPLMMYMPIRNTGKFLTINVQEKLQQQNTEWEKFFPGESAWRVQTDSPDANQLCVNFRLLDEQQSMNNHSQTLNELANRGGKSPMELYCIMKKITQNQYKGDKTSVDFLNEFYTHVNELIEKRREELRDNLEEDFDEKQQGNSAHDDSNHKENIQDNAAILKSALENINFPSEKISEEVARILMKKQLIERNYTGHNF